MSRSALGVTANIPALSTKSKYLIRNKLNNLSVTSTCSASIQECSVLITFLKSEYITDFSTFGSMFSRLLYLCSIFRLKKRNTVLGLLTPL